MEDLLDLLNCSTCSRCSLKGAGCGVVPLMVGNRVVEAGGAFSQEW